MGMSEFYGTPDEQGGIDTIHRALDLGDHLPRHRRHVRPVHQRAARRQGHQRPPRRRAAGHQVRQQARPERRAARHRRLVRTTCARPATPRCSGSASTTSTSTTSTASTRPSRSRRPSARWPSWSRPARSATSGCPRRARPDIRRAHAVHPITALQTRVLPVHPRPRGRDPRRDPGARDRAGALLPARARPAHRHHHEGLGADGEADNRRSSYFPRFQGEALDANLALVEKITAIADDEGLHARPARAGVGAGAGRRRGPDPRHQAGEVPRGERRRQRRGAHREDLDALEQAVPRDAVAGDRYGDMSPIDA